MGTLAELIKHLISVPSKADLQEVLKIIFEAQAAEKESIQNLKQCLKAATLMSSRDLVQSPRNESLEQGANEATVLSPRNQVLSPRNLDMSKDEAVRQETGAAIVALKILNEGLKTENIALMSMKQEMEATILALRSENQDLLAANHALRLGKHQSQVSLRTSSRDKEACNCMVPEGGNGAETVLVEEIMQGASDEIRKAQLRQSSSDYLGSDASTDAGSDSDKTRTWTPWTVVHQENEIFDVGDRVMSLIQLTFNRATLPKYSMGTIVAPGPDMRVSWDTLGSFSGAHVLSHQIQKVEDTAKQPRFRLPHSTPTPLHVWPCPSPTLSPRSFSYSPSDFCTVVDRSKFVPRW